MKVWIDWLDEQFSKITMYNLVVIGLALLSIVALGLMVSGYITYAPINFVITIIILSSVSYASNRLFGYLFGIQPHSQSAVITGLILALLFTPATSLFICAKYALIAIIAMASKYVLTYRNKHIFNPAAIAIVIASLTKIAFASWWIATPALLPVTFIVSLAILFKTRKMTTAGVYVAVSVATIIVMTLISGNLTTQSVVAALTSWPLIFFAGIMLSEPLTMPPRHKQQLIIAGLVGFLGVLSIHYGPITMTPALALIIGNAVAWRWGTRGVIRLRFLHKKRLSKSAYEFTFDTNHFQYAPGQYIDLTLPHSRADARGLRRAFSVIGQPSDSHIRIATRIQEKPSSFKKRLVSLRKGETVYAARVAGDFVMPADESIPVIMIAGGIGITPFLSHIQAAATRKMTLIYVATAADEMLYAEELRQYTVNVVIVSPTAPPAIDPSWVYVASKSLTPEVLKKCMVLYDRPHIYISGAPHMVNETKRMAKKLGAQHVVTDHFAGY